MSSATDVIVPVVVIAPVIVAVHVHGNVPVDVMAPVDADYAASPTTPNATSSNPTTSNPITSRKSGDATTVAVTPTGAFTFTCTPITITGPITSDLVTRRADTTTAAPRMTMLRARPSDDAGPARMTMQRRPV